jgi:hypothetical protein
MQNLGKIIIKLCVVTKPSSTTKRSEISRNASNPAHLAYLLALI